MKKLKKLLSKLIYIVLAFSLLGMQITPAFELAENTNNEVVQDNLEQTDVNTDDEIPLEEDVGGEVYSALTPEISSITVTSGYIQQSFSTTTYQYNMVLGANEPSFSLVSTPVETEYAPKMEVFLDGSPEAYCTLTNGVPSRVIPVEINQTRTVMVRSTPYTQNLQKPYLDYTFNVFRTSTSFKWQVGSVTQLSDGKQMLPVTLYATPGAQLKDLSFAVGFDPSVLQLCDANGNITDSQTQCITPVSGFTYVDVRDGFFESITYSSSNAQGIMKASYGGNTTLLNNKKSYTVGDTGELLTANFIINGNLKEDSLYILRSNDSPTTGIASTNGNGVVLAGNSIITIEGLPQTNHTYNVTLPQAPIFGGSIDVTPSKASYQSGETITIKAQPQSGYAFSSWNFGDTQLSGSSQTLTLTVDKDIDLSSLSAVFYRLANIPSASGVDADVPFTGEKLLTVSGFTKTSTRTLKTTQDNVVSEMDIDRYGRNILDFNPDEGDVGNEDSFSQEGGSTGTYNVGDKRTFLTRDSRSSSSQTWVSKTFTLKAVDTGIFIWFEDGNKMQVTDAQFTELASSYATKMSKIVDMCGPVYDRDGNGGLDILIYDIQDIFTETNGGSNSYIAGLASYGELYGLSGGKSSVGNNADVLHIDSYPAMGTNYQNPDLTRIQSTMAHETQHLSTFSVNSSSKLAMTSTEIKASLPPTWLNEALSLAVEHQLFGPLSSRINTFNTSTAIKNGYSLTTWGSQLEDYALSYLFISYLQEQAGAAGISNFLSNFYDQNTTFTEQAILTTIQKIPQFASMDLDQVLTCFYSALYLQQDTGIYGFNGADGFRTVQPQTATTVSTTLPASAAVFTILNQSSSTNIGGNDYIRVGLTPPELTLTSTADQGGTITFTNAKASYSRGDYVVLTAVPEEGYEFTGWTSEVAINNPSDVTITISMQKSVTIHANFAPIIDSPSENTDQTSVDIAKILGTDPDKIDTITDPSTATYQPTNGTVSLQTTNGAEINKVTLGQDLKLTAQPNSEYSFSHWILKQNAAEDESFALEGDPTILYSNPLFIKASENLAYEAVFTLTSLSATYQPTLGVMDLSIVGNTTDDRKLVSNPNGRGDQFGFGFDEKTFNYDIYLFDGEQAKLSINTLSEITGISVTGKQSQYLQIQDDTQHSLKWVTDSGEDLVLDLPTGEQQATVTLTVNGSKIINDKTETGESTYVITLHRLTDRPVTEISSDGTNVKALIKNAEFTQFSISIKVPDSAFDTSETATSITEQINTLNTTWPQELQITYAKVESGILNLVISSPTGAIYKSDFEFNIFEAESLSGITSNNDSSYYNNISDWRFGTLNKTTLVIGATATIKGMISAYGSAEPTFVIKKDGNAVETATISVTKQSSTNPDARQSFDFEISELEVGTYSIIIQKTSTTSVTLSNVVLQADQMLDLTQSATVGIKVITLYSGDIDADGSITVFDLNKLKSKLFDTSPGNQYDLNGDGVVDYFDLALLQKEENYGAESQTIALT